VQAAVDQVTGLPEEAEDPSVRRGQWRDRVTDVVLTGPVGVEQLALFADEFVVRLFSAGVTRTTIQGVAAAQILIEVPSANLISNDVSMAEIAAAIAAEVDADPAGDVSGGSARVRTGIEKRSAEQIADIVLRSTGDGSKLTVGNIATLSTTGVDRNRGYFVGDNPAISIRVDRSDAGDAIGIQAQVEQVAAALQETLPQGVTLELIRTRSEVISGRLELLLDNALTGLALVVTLLFLFLNARTALWVAAGIPVALFAAIALMYLGGLTINMISLFALIITLGIVVDDAIVVGEHADYRYRALGEPPVVAAENAARRMAMPVFSATLTTIIAFFGLVFISGRFGTLIADIPFTVIAVLAASLIECFLILPHHMSHALSHSVKIHWYDLPSRIVNIGFEWVRDKIFRPLMAGVIWARYAVLAGVIVALAGQVALVISGDVQWRFFNAPERSSVTGNFAMVEGASRADTLAMMQEMQRATNELATKYEAEHGVSPLDYVMGSIGGNAGRGLAGTENKDADLLGGISIELIDADLRPYSRFAFVADLQDAVRRHPLVETVSFRSWRSGPGGSALSVQFFGASAETLKAASQAMQTELARFPEVSAVEDNLAYDKEEVILELTAQGQALGFTIDQLGRVLRHRLNGIEAASFPDGPRSATIRVELPKDELRADFLDSTLLRARSGDYVPLADIVSVTQRTGFSTVRRENGIRLISVTGDISEDDPARATEIEDTLEQQILPDIASNLQVEWRLSGQSEQENTFLSDALTGLILALTGIYLVLSWVFSSWTRPMVVMAVIPFGLVGTIYGHAAWDVPLSMFSVVGLLGMTGIIINDSIVLVTTIDQYAKERGLIPSIIDGAANRLRPVLLTTLTTVLGLTPLLFERSSQAQFLKPTVITLVYGLGFGMILVLLVVPALMAMQYDVGRRIEAFKRGLKFRARGPRLLLNGLAGIIALWLAATMGYSAVTGALLPDLAALSPRLENMPAMPASFALFALGTALVVGITWIAGTAVLGMRRMRSSA
jgi:multidrug efflux pump subunit AcrB